MLWVQDDGRNSCLYYDESSSGVYVKELSDHAPGIQVYPNPVVTEASMQIIGLTAEDGILDLLDVKGRIVQRLIIGIPVQGKVEAVIDMNDLEMGIYFLRLSDGNRSLRRKFIKISTD